MYADASAIDASPVPRSVAIRGGASDDGAGAGAGAGAGSGAGDGAKHSGDEDDDEASHIMYLRQASGLGAFSAQQIMSAMRQYCDPEEGMSLEQFAQ